jgi:PPM family protein phosphatase
VLVESAAKTDVGRKKDHNEDSVAFFPEVGRELKDANFYLVADGMGGVSAGEVASALIVESFKKFFVVEKDFSDHAGLLRRVFRLANNAVFDYAAEHPENKGMGSTGVAIHFDDRHAYIGNIGDSRCYRMRSGKLELLTRDHSLIQELIESGQIPEEQRNTHPQRNIITRTIGVEEEVEADVEQHELQEGDLFLLCSDGLCGHVDHEKIEARVQAYGPGEDGTSLAQVASDLIDLANDEGSPDNISAILVKVSELGGGTADGAKESPAAAEAALLAEDEPSNTGRSLLRSIAVGVVLLAIGGGLVWRMLQPKEEDEEWGKDGLVIRVAAARDKDGTMAILGDLAKLGVPPTNTFLKRSDQSGNLQDIFVWGLEGEERIQEFKDSLAGRDFYHEIEVNSLPYSVQIGGMRPDKKALSLRTRVLNETNYYPFWQQQKEGYRLLLGAFATSGEAEVVARQLVGIEGGCRAVLR